MTKQKPRKKEQMSDEEYEEIEACDSIEELLEEHESMGFNQCKEQYDQYLDELFKDLDKYWGFDNDQQHTHSWHDKQEFFKKWR